MGFFGKPMEFGYYINDQISSKSLNICSIIDPSPIVINSIEVLNPNDSVFIGRWDDIPSDPGAGSAWDATRPLYIRIKSI